MSRLMTSLAASICVMIPVAVQAAPAPTLPDGPGRAQVQQVCTQCHNVNQILNSSGYSRAHWQELIGNMIDLSAAPQDRDTIVNYLATTFPPNTRRASTPVAGPVKISIQQWKVPTLGQRSRDPVMTQDGMIWWNGQFGNVVGRLDPKTGAMKEFALPAGAKPHSITPDAQGNIWYTGNGNGTVGRIDVKSGDIKVYPMPDPAAKDPHTAQFAPNGVLWFTVQNSQMIGKLDPKTGEVKLVKVRADSNPYDVRIDSAGVPWMSCSESNCIYRVDPATMAVQEFKLPAGSGVRRFAFASDGMIWYGNSLLGTVGRMDPKTGATKEWASPSGPQSSPYGFEIINDVIWYNESGKRPDMLVRFDPKTEKFQSWPIQSGNVYAGIVRHMRKTPIGDLLIHQSSTNHIMRVSIDDGRKQAAAR